MSAFSPALNINDDVLNFQHNRSDNLSMLSSFKYLPLLKGADLRPLSNDYIR